MGLVHINKISSDISVLSVSENNFGRIIFSESEYSTGIEIKPLKKIEFSAEGKNFDITYKGINNRSENDDFSNKLDIIFHQHQNDPLMMQIKQFALEVNNEYYIQQAFLLNEE